ncbi:hypothetical protein AURDEDRAFT_186706 [Auricularia subglabra TFB-10046 SS5]|nr:hypothetical protein AURDEDRAFT_186706 [Auricularia subglabra TFB-10046 SS5]
MSHKELGYDELSVVMMLVTGNSIDDKFKLSHVCRSWRNVALSTPRLWSCFAVRTAADVLRLPLVIKRASPRMSVPMDITLDFGARKVVHVEGQEVVVPLIDIDDRLAIYQDLEPHMPFAQRLCIKFGAKNPKVVANEPLSRLFTFATPALEQIAVFYSTVRDRQAAEQPVLPVEAAPRLRSLSLISAIPQNWETVISSTLETLYLRVSGLEPDMLVRILTTCPRLTRLSFLPICRNDFAFDTRSFTTKLEQMRSLHIGGPFANIWSTISPMLCLEVLESITVSIPRDSPAGIAADIGQSIFPDAWSPVSCAVSTFHWSFHPMLQRDIRLADGAGRERDLLAACPAPLCFCDVWRSLAAKTNALDTIASFVLSATPAHWAEVSNAFYADPPRHPGFHLRLPLRRREARLYNAHRQLGTLTCPSVQRVTIEVDDRLGLELQTVLAVIDHIAHQSTALCVVDAFAEKPDRVWVSEWLVRLQDELSQRNGWVLCRHCADHII